MNYDVFDVRYMIRMGIEYGAREHEFITKGKEFADKLGVQAEYDDYLEEIAKDIVHEFNEEDATAAVED